MPRFALLLLLLAASTGCATGGGRDGDAGSTPGLDAGMSDSGMSDSGTPRCTAPSMECAGTCVLVASDPAHCGRCDNACAGGEACTDGACGPSACASVDETRCGASCVDTRTDTMHCGGCDMPCAAGEACMSGMCRDVCPAGMTDCSGTCADLQIAPAHCGMCNNACAAGEVCAMGTCGTSCPAGTTPCGSGATLRCPNLQSAETDCGLCDAPCAGAETCILGICRATENCTNGVDDDGDTAADCADTDCAASPACMMPLCSGLVSLNGASGTITDGSGAANYASFMSCSWRIVHPGATAIDLDFSAFELEDCCDYVTVYGGTSASGTLLGRFNGTSLPPRVRAVGDSMFVSFTTDLGGNYDGFTADYSITTAPVESCANGADEDGDGATDCADSDCATHEACTPVPCAGVVDRSAPTGVVQDGSGPTANYRNNSNCGWRITVPGAISMQLDFSEMSTEMSYDWVTVYEGTGTGGRLVGRFSGASLPPRLFANGSSMYVQFTSDPTGTAAGFRATYTARSVPLESCANGADEDSDALVDCADSDCAAHEACAAVPCMGVVDRSAPTGVVQDGSGPSANYASNSNCGWRITVPGAISMQLDFSEMSTEMSYDWVTIYEGTGTSGRQVGRFSGASLPPRIFANGSSMYVQFTSDPTGTAPGFRAVYTARSVPLETCTNGTDEDSDSLVDCADSDCAASEACAPVLCSGTVTRSAPSGTIQDGSGTANYQSNMNCGWRIQVPSATSIRLAFTQFSTENMYDWVTVYQGTSTSGMQLGRFSGTALPAAVTASGDAMFVTFTSDTGTTSGGFVASYTSMP